MAVRLQFAQMYFCQMCLKILRTDVVFVLSYALEMK